MFRFHKLTSQKGEIALTFTIVGILMSLVGIGLGVASVQQEQSRSASAGGIFTYKSTLELRDEQGNVVDWEPGMTWKTDLT